MRYQKLRKRIVTVDIGKTMRARAEQLGAASADKFTLSAVKKLCQYLDIEQPKFVKGSATAWFRDTYPRFPVRIEVRKLKKCNINDMFMRMSKTEQWDQYMALLEEQPDSHIGLIVQVTGLGLFIQHNAWHLDSAPGHTRLTRRAISSDKGIIFESVEAFAATINRSGWSP